MDFLYAFIDSFVNLCDWNSTETYHPWIVNKEDKVPERLVNRIGWHGPHGKIGLWSIPGLFRRLRITTC